MTKAKNEVIAGDFAGKKIIYSFGAVSIDMGLGRKIAISKSSVESYELVTDEHRKSAASGIARGLVGGALLGPIGALAGGLSAKSKGIYQVVIQFKEDRGATSSGKRSLVEVDDQIYKAIVKNCFV